MSEVAEEREPLDDNAREARTFVVLAVASGLTAWDFGFDLGAFDNIDHRRFWTVWVFSTIALVASFLFSGAEFDRIARWRIVLAFPTLWLFADFLLSSEVPLITNLLTLASVATLPFSLYLLFRLLAGDFFTLYRRSQVALVALAGGIFLVGLYVGTGHERFLTCDDFARSGDFVPADCTP